MKLNRPEIERVTTERRRDILSEILDLFKKRYHSDTGAVIKQIHDINGSRQHDGMAVKLK